VADIIQVRRDTAANWTSVDPVLADGEWGYETNTGKLKLGNGVGKWSTLAYLIGDVDAIHDNVASEIHAIAQKTPPVANDELLIEDSAAAYAKKRVLISEFSLASHSHTYFDPDAVHTNAANEIGKLTAVTPVSGDFLLIEDLSDSLNKKKVDVGNFADSGHTHTYYDAAAIHDNEANEISAITEKTTPANNDLLVIEDSADSYVKKRLKFSNLPAGGLTQAQVLARGLGA
jgi:hypothetical protein